MMTEETIFVDEAESDELRDRQIFPDYQVQKIIGKYVCAQCWGTLMAQPAHRNHYLIFCPECGEGQGFHTRHFAEARFLWSNWDYQEAFKNLADVLGLEQKPFDEKQTLKDLGFD